MELVTISDVRAAAERIRGTAVRTHALAQPWAPGLWLKLESLQPVGSFKVSGGGLASGVGVALKALCPGARLIGVEPALAADTTEGLRLGRRVDWPVHERARTMADGLRAQPTDLTFAHLRKVVDEMITVTEQEIRNAVRTLARDARFIAEPSGAVTTAAYLSHRDAVRAEKTVAVVSGGNIDPDMLTRLLK